MSNKWNPPNFELEITTVIQRLTRLQAELAKMNTMSPERMTQLGVMLGKVTSLTSKIVAPIKIGLRAAAEEDSQGDPGSIEYYTDDGKCIVVIQSSRVKVRKDANMLLAQHEVPDFPKYFDAKVVYKPVDNFLALAHKATPETMTALDQLVDIKTDQPRVTFKPNKGTK